MIGPDETRHGPSSRLSLVVAGPLIVLVPLVLCGCSLLQSVGLLSSSQRVATPLISPAGGSYSADQSVTITDQTSGAVIYYTTDGSTPTSGSERYSGAITVAGNGEDMSIQAVAIKSGMLASAIVGTNFLIQYGKGLSTQAAAPSFTPPPGSYNSDQTVSLSDSTAGAKIYFTTDGSTPTTASAQYSSPISVSGDGTKMTIRAVAVAAGDAASPVVSALFQISNTNASPSVSFSVASGTYTSPQSVSITGSPTNATVYYTTDGSTPTTSSAVYSGAITISGPDTTETIKAIAVASSADSPVESATYTVRYQYQLSVVAGVGGTVTPTTTQTADYGAATNITAASSSGYSFGYWEITSGTGAFLSNASSATTTVELSTNATVEAVFTGNIKTVAGDGTSGYTGDTGLATAAELKYPNYVSISPTSGNLYISDNGNQVVRKVTVSTGDISTVAGDGTAGYSGDGGLPTSAELDNPDGVFAAGGGVFLIADQTNQRIRVVKPAAPSTVITTEVGNGTPGYAGDNGSYSSTTVELHNPFDVAEDSSGNLYIADSANNVIREVSASTGEISTLAGNGTQGLVNGPAASAEFNAPVALAVDSSGNLYVADSGNNVVREITVAGTVKTVAGDGTAGFSGDGGPATSAELSDPVGIAVDSSGNIYISDRGNNRIREVNAATGIITTIAGSGTAGYSGDGGGALFAEFNQPGGLAIDSAGNLYVADTSNNVVREFPTRSQTGSL